MLRAAPAGAVDEREPVALRSRTRRSNAACEIVIGPRPSASSTGESSIAAHRQGELRALGGGDREARRRRCRWCSVAQPVVDDRAVGAERSATRVVEPSLPVEREQLGDRRRVDRVDDLLVAERERRRPGGSRVTAVHAGRGGDRARDRRVDRRPAVRAGDRRASPRCAARACRVVVSLQARGDHGDRGHQRDADHQRRRGDGRAARVAHRVAAGEPRRRSRRAARPGGRPPTPAARTARASSRTLRAARVGVAQRRHRRRPASRAAPGSARRAA